MFSKKICKYNLIIALVWGSKYGYTIVIRVVLIEGANVCYGVVFNLNFLKVNHVDPHMFRYSSMS